MSTNHLLSRIESRPTTQKQTPDIRILFVSRQNANRSRFRDPNQGNRKVLLAAFLVLAATTMGSIYWKANRHLIAIEIASVPDYARYQWEGFHRIAPQLDRADVQV